MPSEKARLPRCADEDRRMRVGGHVGKIDPIRRAELPGGEPVAALCKGRLKRLQAGHALDH